MRDLVLRLFRILRILWLSWWNPAPEISAGNPERLREIDARHHADLAEFDQQLRPQRAQVTLRSIAVPPDTALAKAMERAEFLSTKTISRPFHSSSGSGVIIDGGYPTPAPKRDRDCDLLAAAHAGIPYSDNHTTGMRQYADGIEVPIP